VLFLTYKRYNTAKQVFESIRKAKPPRLYFASNAPNPNITPELAEVQKVRDLLATVDWDCEVTTLFRSDHLSVKESISSAISWFFEHEEQGIILEDDCLPHQDFFTFCDALLKRYKNEVKVWVITGDNYQNNQIRGEASYYFSRYNHVWGWASWRRAWENYSVDMNFWNEWKYSDSFKNYFNDPIEEKFWRRKFDDVLSGKIVTWDYQWTFCVFKNNGLTATPNKNLVTNIGFGPEATNTTSEMQIDTTTKALGKITYTDKIIRNVEADQFVFKTIFYDRSVFWPKRGIELFKIYLKKLLKKNNA